MAKEIAVGKRAKISQAQQYVLLAVLGASLFLGATIALVLHFSRKISFNAEVIAAQDKSIVAYSKTISGIGICEAPKGDVYNNKELEKCNPEAIQVSSIPNTLRANILEKMAANSALNSAPNESAKGCTNPVTDKNYTYDEMKALYQQATTSEQIEAAAKLIQVCSALRIIPDALPALENEEALLASLIKIFTISDETLDSLSPIGSSSASSLGSNLMALPIRLSVDESDAATTKRFLSNIERSIREFDINRATISISSQGGLTLQAQATAFYMNPTTITEITQTIKSGDDNK